MKLPISVFIITKNEELFKKLVNHYGGVGLNFTIVLE